MRAELRTELMALIHVSVEALDGSDAVKQLVGICMRSSKPSSQLCGSIGIREKACGFVAFCKGCNGKARVFCHPIYATLSCLFLTAMVKNIYCIYVGYALLPTPPIYATLSCQRPL